MDYFLCLVENLAINDGGTQNSEVKSGPFDRDPAVAAALSTATGSDPCRARVRMLVLRNSLLFMIVLLIGGIT